MAAGESVWDQRIERAEELAGLYAFSGEILRFYVHITRFQKTLHELLLSLDTSDWSVLVPRFRSFLELTERVGTPELAASAKELAEAGPARWEEILAGENFFARAFLQPYSEFQAARAGVLPQSRDCAACPFCGGRPGVAVLRPEGDGAKRSLVCSRCLTEWDYRRIACPACSEEQNLSVYTAEQFPYLRVEACDSCKAYIKAVDLSKNGRAVPVVDELAATPLDLWARDKGYVKLAPNLLGL